jgi:hypothetical protein
MANAQYMRNGHSVSITDDAQEFQISLDGTPVSMCYRFGPGTYYTHLFSYQYFASAQDMANQLADTEGTLWMLGLNVA